MKRRLQYRYRPLLRALAPRDWTGGAPASPDRITKTTVGYVYFVREGDDGPIKIGWARNPAVRLRGLQGGNPRSLKLLGSMPGTIAMEHDLHRRFVHLRAQREWFRPEPELLAYLEGAGMEQHNLSDAA